MFKKISSVSLVITLAACSSMMPYGKGTETTTTYYYWDSLSAHSIWRCLEAGIGAKGLIADTSEYNRKSDLNRMMIYHGGNNVGMLDVFSNQNRVSSMAFANNKSTKSILDNVQNQCVSISSYNNTPGVSIVEGIIEGLK